jgi:hypothetical protein
MRSFTSILTLFLASSATAFVVKPIANNNQRTTVATVQQPQSTSSFLSAPSVSTSSSSSTQLMMAENSPETEKKLPFFLDPATKGGVLVLMVVLFVVPIVFYNLLINVGGMDDIEAGIDVGIGFTVISTLAWMGTYLFRVATKDMTYVS